MRLTLPRSHTARSRRRPARLAIALLTAAACAVALAGCSGPEPDGPFRMPNPHGYGGIVVSDGGDFTDGFDVLQFDGPSPVTIRSVTLFHTDSHLELVDASYAGDDRQGAAVIQYQLGAVHSGGRFGVIRPIPNAVLDVPTDPLRGVELLLHMRVHGSGRFVRGGYTVAYTVDGHDYESSVTAEITVCTPDYVERAGSCDMADE